MTLSPEITQSMRDGEEGLVYEWRKREGNGLFRLESLRRRKDSESQRSAAPPTTFITVLPPKTPKPELLPMLKSRSEWSSPLENAWFVLPDADGRPVVGAVD